MHASLQDTSAHIPVMLDEVLEYLAPKDNEVIVDGTFGRGGYTKGILTTNETCHVIAFDQDPRVQPYIEEVSNIASDRFLFIKGRFGDMKRHLADHDIHAVDGIVLDIGVSSMQLDESERGFSFRFDGPLDMRMSSEGPTAADLVNTLPEEELANIIYTYGEERHSRRIAKAIVTRRQETAFTTTLDLADIVRTSLPKGKPSKIDPATRTFQALRIAVNDELKELEKALEQSISLLKENGRLVVVTFHSLEDGIVKKFLKENTAPHKAFNKYRPETQETNEQPYIVLTKKPVSACEKEIQTNPRSRSAKLRAALRTQIANKKGETL